MGGAPMLVQPSGVIEAGEASLALSVEGEGEPLLSASEGPLTEARVLGSSGVPSGQRRPALAPDRTLFGDRWVASVAAATAMGGSLLEALALPWQAASALGTAATLQGGARGGRPSAPLSASSRGAAFLSESITPGTAPTTYAELPATRPPTGALDMPLRDRGTPRLAQGSSGAGTTPFYSSSVSLASGGPTSASWASRVGAAVPRSIWEEVTLLPGILTPAYAIAAAEERRPSPSGSRAPEASGEPTSPTAESLGGAPTRFDVLEAASLVRRAVLGGSAGPLGARQIGGLAPGTAFVAGPPYPAGGVPPTAPGWIATTPTSATPRAGIESTSAPEETEMRGGLAGIPPARYLETLRFPSIQAALTSIALLGASLSLPAGAAEFLPEGPPPSASAASVAAGPRDIPARSVPAQTAPPAESRPAESALGAPRLLETGRLEGPIVNDFFGLEAVAQAISIASRLPSTSQVGGSAFVFPQRVVPPTRAAGRAPPARSPPAQVQLATERPAEVNERLRSASEEAISEVLADTSSRPSLGGASPHEPDDRELRKRIERMIEEELRRYGYQT